MKSKLLIIGIVLLMMVGCTANGKEEVGPTENSEVIKVAVSIPPQKAFVEAVAGDKVEVTTMIPPGSSPANYQPSAKEMQGLSDATIYYAIGVPAEVSFIRPRLEDFNKELVTVDLFERVEETYPARTFAEEEEEESEEGHDEHHHEGEDPHIWLSPKRVQLMIDAIAESLSEKDPDNEEFYIANADSYKEKLVALDKEMKDKLVEGTPFIVYHPSMGYLADDYGLEMVAVEASGKEATAKGLEEVIEFAKTKGVDVIFYQKEFSAKQAKIIAEEINGRVVELNILSEDYIENMRLITNQLAGE